MQNKSKITTRTLIISISAVFALCLAAMLILHLATPKNTWARVTQDGKILYEIDLSTVTDEREITIESEEGFNIISVKNGAVRVVDADCPDRPGCRPA